LQQGQTKAAIVSLAAAARLAPAEARFRAYYGRALATVEATRRLAEAELQAALKLDPENFGYRLMLAELYFDLGFLRRAEGELKRALIAEPNNPSGLKLLRRIEAAAT
jgi:predicted Zn-dependent protease